MDNSFKDTQLTISESPWRNTYWFARMLLNGDKYGAVGKKSAFIERLVAELEAILAQEVLNDDEKFSVCKNTLLTGIKNSSRIGTDLSYLAENFSNDMEIEIQSLNDIIIFILTVKYIVLPINAALPFVPSNDREFCHSTAKNILDTLGEEKVDKVLSVWDNLGVKGCLDAERSIIVTEFTKLRNNLNALDLQRTEIEDNMLLTAFIQEFERRLGQKRKTVRVTAWRTSRPSCLTTTIFRRIRNRTISKRILKLTSGSNARTDGQ